MFLSQAIRILVQERLTQDAIAKASQSKEVCIHAAMSGVNYSISSKEM